MRYNFSGLLLAATLALACTDSQAPGGGQSPPPSPFIVSSPFAMPLSLSAGLAVTGSSASGEVYISLPPGSIPDGSTATILDPRVGSSTIAILVDGGFDPVPIAAAAGDTLAITVHQGATGGPVSYAVAVPEGAPPIVVRTSPPPHKRDVPLNSTVVIVFSQPIDAATLNTGSVQLWRNTTPVSGTVQFSDTTHLRAEFHPATLLAGHTDYRIVVTGAVHDVNGIALTPSPDVGFTTGVAAQLASRLIFQVGPSTISVGQPFAVQVAITDSLGAPVTGVSATVILALGVNPTGSTLTGALSATTTDGVVTFNGLSLDRAGDGYTLVAESGSLPSASSENFSVVKSPTALVFASASAGFYHTCLTTTGGAVYCWGDNIEGQAGVGDTTSQWMSPVLPIGGLSFATVSAGDFHTCGLTLAGTAYCWGENVNAAVGDGTTINRSSPVPVTGGVSFTALSPGAAHTCGVAASGAAYCWGYNGAGELGDGTTTNRSTPTLVAGGLTFAQVSAGLNHSCGVTVTGDAWCWGQNTYGQLGDGTTTDRPSPVLVLGGLRFTAVHVGEHHTCGITDVGAAYCWGWNGAGQLGNGATTDQLSPVQVVGGLNFSSLSAIAYQTCGLTSTGAAYCWGINGQGQLGDGTATNQSSPAPVAGGLAFAEISTGYHHTCGVTTVGVAYCWGAGWNGMLGDGTAAQSSVPVKVAGQP